MYINQLKFVGYFKFIYQYYFMIYKNYFDNLIYRYIGQFFQFFNLLKSLHFKAFSFSLKIKKFNQYCLLNLYICLYLDYRQEAKDD